ncbi:MAG: hypothetical protein Q9170_008321 [Blastenia crenularia]
MALLSSSLVPYPIEETHPPVRIEHNGVEFSGVDELFQLLQKYDGRDRYEVICYLRDQLINFSERVKSEIDFDSRAFADPIYQDTRCPGADNKFKDRKTILAAWPEAERDGFLPPATSYNTISEIRRAAGSVPDYREAKGRLATNIDWRIANPGVGRRLGAEPRKVDWEAVTNKHEPPGFATADSAAVNPAFDGRGVLRDTPPTTLNGGRASTVEEEPTEPPRPTHPPKRRMTQDQATSPNANYRLKPVAKTSLSGRVADLSRLKQPTPSSSPSRTPTSPSRIRTSASGQHAFHLPKTPMTIQNQEPFSLQQLE